MMMDTQDFLREAVLRLEKDLEKTRDSNRQLGEAIAKLDKDIGVLEMRVTSDARFHAVTWAIASGIVIKILGAFFHGE